jgi:hypothetical protein
VKYLLPKYGRVDVDDDMLCTPLMLAAASGALFVWPVGRD